MQTGNCTGCWSNYTWGEALFCVLVHNSSQQLSHICGVFLLKETLQAQPVFSGHKEGD